MPEQLNTNVIGLHWRTVDLSPLMARHLYALQQDLAESGADIPARKLFVLEALGFSVDLETGLIEADGGG